MIEVATNNMEIKSELNELTKSAQTMNSADKDFVGGSFDSKSALDKTDVNSDAKIYGLDESSPSYLQLQNVLKTKPNVSQVIFDIKDGMPFKGTAKVIDQAGKIIYESGEKMIGTKERLTTYLVDLIAQNVPDSNQIATEPKIEAAANKVQITGLDESSPSYLQLQNALTSNPKLANAAQVIFNIQSGMPFKGTATVIDQGGKIIFETGEKMIGTKERLTTYLVSLIAEF